ncbi:hypothetical protein PybrP1_010727 [[Pythium] brassicae (nom. inval.)]|nr:hypothetical protein PybrP1_010727 [[Pythium] brassicae (nom. inval.)]
MTHDRCCCHKQPVVLPPAVIVTSQPWDELPRALERFRESKWKLQQSPARRAKSHSPTRRSPKLKHTNGRLNEDPVVVVAVATSAGGRNSGGRGPRLLTHENKQQLLACIQSTATDPTRVTKDRGMSESEIPKRAGLITRSVTSTPPAHAQRVECLASEPLSSSPVSRRLMRACFRDQSLRERSAENTRRMIVIARLNADDDWTTGDSTTTACVSSNQQQLALKALKYRKLLTRAREIDDERLQDPTFDVLEGLGLKWCKAES